VLGKGGDFVEKAKQLGLGVDVFNGRLDKEGYLSYLRQNKTDVINAHYSVFGADIAHKLGIPFIQTIHNSYVWLDQNEIEKYRQCDALTSLYTCVSLSVAKYTDYVLGLDVSKMRIIPNGIDQSIFADICPQTERERLREKWGIDETNKVFLNVASILATKAQLPLVRAFSQIVKSHPNARLVLLGAAMDEAYEKKIREFLRSSKLEQNVIFTGYDRKVAGYYYAADIFVLPSFWEGWSLSFGEALFTGIPIVSTNVGAAQEFEDIGNVMLVSPPFGDVTNLNSLNLAKYVYGNDEDFITRLFTALDKAMTLDRIPVNSSFHQQLDRAKAYEAYSELFLSVH
jgi:glycosyltransferase involved in cell wall biosynthesis